MTTIYIRELVWNIENAPYFTQCFRTSPMILTLIKSATSKNLFSSLKDYCPRFSRSKTRLMSDSALRSTRRSLAAVFLNALKTLILIHRADFSQNLDLD